MKHWLMKSEPTAFSFDDLENRANRTEPWDGVRNYQARNFMRDRMQVGDPVFFYHSNCAAPGIVGLARIASAAYPDPTQFDPDHVHYDATSTPEQPRWLMVDVQFDRRLRRVLTLAELREHAEHLQGLALLARANRLSVIPVRPEHWRYILSLE